MAGSWEPSKGLLLKTLEAIRVSQWSNSVNQETAQQKVEVLNQSPYLGPDFQRYLMFVFTKLKNIDVNTRVQSGYILDGNIRTHFHRFPAELIDSMKSGILSSLDDPSPVIREYALSLIKTLSFKMEKLANWPDMVPRVCQMLNSEEDSDSEGAFDALNYICQEFSSEIAMIAEQHKELIPKFPQLLNHTNPIIRSRTINCVMQMIRGRNHVLMINVEKLFLGLLEMMKNASDNRNVREKMCYSLNYVLLQYRRVCPDLLVPQMDTIVKYVLDESSVAFNHEICEFWVQLAASRGLCKEFLKQEYLIRLVPVLLKGLQYSESEIIVLLKDDLDEEDDLTYLNMEKELNLTRECSERALRGLSKVFKEDLLRVIWPILLEMLHHSEWKVNDAAIVALGVITDGYETEIKKPTNLIPLQHLISSQSEKEMVERVTWLDQYFEPILKALIKGIMEGNKLVQLSAYSALTEVQRKVSTAIIVPHLDSILEALVDALAKYQRKNRIILYSTIASLVDAVGSHLNEPELINLLLPPLMTIWKALKDDDKDLLPLIKCLSSVAKTVQSSFLQCFYISVFNRCISLMHYQHENQNVLIRAMELLSGLAQGMGTRIHRPTERSDLIELLRQNVKDSRQGVRQASFALLGHLTNASFGLVKAHLKYFLPTLSQNLDNYLDYTLVCDEAVQALGKIAVKFGKRMKGFIPLFVYRLIFIINDRRPFKLDYILRQHAAVTLGRLGASCPESVAPHLQHFSHQWCMSMESMVDEELKQSAFHDMCALITANPGGIVQDFVLFCGVIGSFTAKPPVELKKNIVNTLRAIEVQVGVEEWRRLVVQVSPMILLHECSG